MHGRWLFSNPVTINLVVARCAGECLLFVHKCSYVATQLQLCLSRHMYIIIVTANVGS